MEMTLSFTPQNIGGGLFVMVVGMIIVFFALVGLVYLFKLMSAMVVSTEKKRALDAGPELETAIEPVEYIDEDDDVAAAIAAVMCVLSEEQRCAPGSLMVKPMRRIASRAPQWKQSSI